MRIARITAVCLLLTALAWAQRTPFWEAKPYSKWSANETKRMLENSPWSQKVIFLRGGPTNVSRDILMGTEELLAENDPNNEISYTVNLVSALPVRQAMMRQEMLRIKYDSLSAEQRKPADERAKQLLDQEPGEIVFLINYYSNFHLFAKPLSNYWQQLTLEQVRNNTIQLVTSKGSRIPPIGFQPAQGGSTEIFVAFPRTHTNGEPVVVEGEQYLALEFIAPGVGHEPTRRLLVQFPLGKMAVNGKAQF